MTTETVPLLLSQTEAAKRIGWNRSILSRMATASPLYAPAARGIPGATGSMGRRMVRYHARQLELIVAVQLGRDLVLAEMEWKLFLGKVTLECKPN